MRQMEMIRRNKADEDGRVEKVKEDRKTFKVMHEGREEREKENSKNLQELLFDSKSTEL